MSDGFDSGTSQGSPDSGYSYDPPSRTDPVPEGTRTPQIVPSAPEERTYESAIPTAGDSHAEQVEGDEWAWLPDDDAGYLLADFAGVGVPGGRHRSVPQARRAATTDGGFVVVGVDGEVVRHGPQGDVASLASVRDLLTLDHRVVGPWVPVPDADGWVRDPEAEAASWPEMSEQAREVALFHAYRAAGLALSVEAERRSRDREGPDAEARSLRAELVGLVEERADVLTRLAGLGAELAAARDRARTAIVVAVALFLLLVGVLVFMAASA